MQAPRRLKDLLYPARGDLVRLEFREARWLTAFVPDDERFGLSRELILQRIYDAAGPIGGGTVIDAGAHVGLFSLIAAQHAERVVSLEPDPLNFRVLDLNRRLNEAHNVTALECALWKEDGEVPFRPSWHTTGGSVRRDGKATVAARGLDGLVEEHGPVDLLKLDVEGAEAEVLPAARRLGGVRRIVAELHLSRPGEERPLVDALTDGGFDVRVLPAASLYEPRWARTVLRNWSALRGQAAVKLGLLAYLLLPLEKPRRPAGARDMPLLVASR